MKTLSILAVLLLSAAVFASEQALLPQPAALLPLVFEANQGQAPSEYSFISRNDNLEFLFSPSSVDVITRANDETASRVSLRFLGMRAGVVPAGGALLPSYSNYFLGNDPAHWLSRVRHHSQVVYSDAYPGIDIIFHGNREQFEQDYRVAPHARPELVSFAIAGAHDLKLDASGNLEAVTAGGKLVFRKPLAYQHLPQGRVSVQAGYVLGSDGSVEIRVGNYDKDRELVIDPVFGFSTYLAGSGQDVPAAVTTDAAGNVYVTGYTSSLDFPVVNGIESTGKGSPNVFVSKLDATGHSLLYSTYIGGSSQNFGNAIALDASGNIIVAGTSSSLDFPHAGSVPGPTNCSFNDSCFFVASLKADGSAFNYVGRIGGRAGINVSFGPGGAGILTVDGSGNAFLASATDDAQFQITPGTLATTVPGYPVDSTFVMKVAPSGALVFSTIVPGTATLDPLNPLINVFLPTGISVDASGQATIAGTAGPGLPSTVGVVQPTFPNDTSVAFASAGFVLQLNATASAIKYATYIAGTDTIGGLAVDSHGNSYVTGGTNESTLPVTANAYQKTLKPGPNCTCGSGFIVELNGSGTAVLAATYLEGTPPFSNIGTNFTGIALDAASNVFVGGMTGSSDFPLQNPFVSLWETGVFSTDMVLAGMSPDLSTLQFGSYLSSTGEFPAGSTFGALTTDSNNDLVVVGTTAAMDFPTTSGSYQTTPPDQQNHGFVAKLDMSVPAPSFCPDRWAVSFGQVPAGGSGTQTVHVTNCGNAGLSFSSLVSSAPTVTATQSCGTTAPGGVCAVTLTYKPVDASAVGGTLTVNDNAVISPQVLQFTGQGVAPQLSLVNLLQGFGHVLVGTSGGVNSLFFTNSGDANLKIFSVMINGDYSIAENSCMGVLIPGDFCVVDVIFSPTAPGIRTGVLTLNSNDPVNPHLGISLIGTGDSLYAVPVVTALSTSAAQINSGPITFDVYGANFYPASMAVVNGIAQTTSYLDQGHLQTTLSTQLSSHIGEIRVQVFNPAPGGGLSVGAILTRYNAVNLDASSLATIPGSNLIYASVFATSSVNPSTVVPINPSSGAMGKAIPVGADPRLLAASDDGSYLYVAANGGQTIQRINMSTKTVDRTFAYPADSCSFCGPLLVADMKAVPGSPQEVVASFADSEGLNGQMALFNDSGVVNSISITATSFAIAGDPPIIYAVPVSIVDNPSFNVIHLGAAGLEFSGTHFGGSNPTGAEIATDGTLLYTVTGEAWDPTAEKQLGTFPVTIINPTSFPNEHRLMIEPAAGHVYLLGDGDSGFVGLSAYGQSSLALTGTVGFSQLFDPGPTSLVRWGANGFAFIAQNSTFTQEAVYVFTSRTAAAPVASNPRPMLTSLSPASAPQGSGDVFLTLNGHEFSPTSVVTWNGTPVTTTVTGPTALMVDVPSSLLTASGSVTVRANTPAPGGGNSNALQFTIEPPAPLISFSSAALSFAPQAVGTTSAAQKISLVNPGTAPLTISSISITGTGAASFHKTTTCGTSLMSTANCTVSVTFKPTGPGAINALLTFTDGAAGSPQSIELSGTGQ